MAVGIPMKTTYIDGDVFSASDVNDITGTINLIGYGAPVVAGKNGVINGGMDIWQRGTTSSGNAYICDRWYSALISGTGTFAQESTVKPSGSNYSQKFTASATAQPAIYQAVETVNALRFANQTVTVSAKVAASTSVGFTIDVQYSTSVDNSVTGTWTSITATSGGTATATSTTFVSISGVYAIPSTAKSLRVRLFTTSTIANTVVVYFGQVQLEQGSAATTFSLAAGTYQGELSVCMRYCQMFNASEANGAFLRYGVGQNVDTTQTFTQIPLSPPMRVVPSLTTTGTAADYGVYSRNTVTACNAAPVLGGNSVSPKTLSVYSTVASGLTQGNAMQLTSNNNTTSYLLLTAEL